MSRPAPLLGLLEKSWRAVLVARTLLTFTPPLRGRASRGECPMNKPSFQGAEGTPLTTGKPTPPTPPCQGGIKRRCLHRIEGLLFFLAPLTRGGRGGCLYPLTRKPSRQMRADSVGGHATEKAPPTNSPAGFALASLSGFPLGKPDPQGGSEIQCVPSMRLFEQLLFPGIRR